MAKTQVFIDGDQGTTGLQIRERLAARNDIALITLPPAQRKDTRHRAQALNDSDVAILCLPDAAAREAVSLVQRDSVRIIDASSAHRTDAHWTYGFPEMAAEQATRIAHARRISNPGCYPTGAIALLRPLIDRGFLTDDAALAIHAVSGYSGGGRAAVERHEGPQAQSASAFQVYGLALEHKHVPEIQRHAGLTQRPVFVPAYGAYRQGIVLTIGLPKGVLRTDVDAKRIREAWSRHYAGMRHIQIADAVPSDAAVTLDPQALNGTNDVRLCVFENAAHGQVLLAAVFDNLGKGAAGAAVQNLDLLLA